MLRAVKQGFGWLDRLWQGINQGKERHLVKLAKRLPLWVTPNLLSWVRIGLASAILVMLFYYHTLRGLIIACFLIAIISDTLDGRIARLRGQETEEGALLDRLGDKLLVCPMVVRLLWQYHPLLASVVVVGEIFSISLAISAMARQVEIKSNWLGQWKMVSQSTGIIILLVLPHRTTWAFGAFVASLPLGAASTWDYIGRYLNSRSKTV